MIARSRPFMLWGAAILVAVQRLVAGGSIGWEDARARIARDDPALVAWVEQTFDVRPAGGAMRVGRQADGRPAVDGAQIGDRLPPFEFPARPKNSVGDYTLYLTLDYSDRKQDGKPLWQVTVRGNVPHD